MGKKLKRDIAHIYKLTRAEFEILKILATGLMHKEIECNRNISISTVKKHCKNIYKKLNVKNKTTAVLIYINTENENFTTG